MSDQLALFGEAPAEEWNPRYTAYAAAHGREPAAMLEHDREAHPGGIMGGFVVWMSGRWAAWDKAFPHRRAHIGPELHADFDAWLKGNKS